MIQKADLLILWVGMLDPTYKSKDFLEDTEVPEYIREEAKKRMNRPARFRLFLSPTEFPEGIERHRWDDALAKQAGLHNPDEDFGGIYFHKEHLDTLKKYKPIVTDFFMRQV